MTGSSFTHTETDGCANNIEERQHSWHSAVSSGISSPWKKKRTTLATCHFFGLGVVDTQTTVLCSFLWSHRSFCNLCVWFLCVCVCVGPCRHLWASLIRECGWAKLLFLRSHFKAGDIEGLFLGPGTCWFSPQTLTSDKTGRRRWCSGSDLWTIIVLLNAGIRTKGRALICRCVTLEMLTVTDLVWRFI